MFARKGALPDNALSQIDGVVRRLTDRAQGSVRTLLVACAGRTEGASTAAVSLARGLSEGHGARVLLVDANLHNPVLHRLTSGKQRNGVAEILAGDIDLETALGTLEPGPGTAVLTAGSPSQDSARLLAGDTLRERVIVPATGFDYLLVDAPAVNQFPDATYVARSCDAALLVVHAGQTRREAALHATQELTGAGCQVLGVLLNRRHYYIPKSLYRWV